MQKYKLYFSSFHGTTLISLKTHFTIHVESLKKFSYRNDSEVLFNIGNIISWLVLLTIRAFLTSTWQRRIHQQTSVLKTHQTLKVPLMLYMWFCCQQTEYNGINATCCIFLCQSKSVFLSPRQKGFLPLVLHLQQAIRTGTKMCWGVAEAETRRFPLCWYICFVFPDKK